ncbi:hypothetical protein [Streptomyces sp. NPDC014733]|uniref:hypothetical protein n=1 Tax=Streptomyces sp. NPDC014733 TaxID=3364885 RepID=UPI003702C925
MAEMLKTKKQDSRPTKEQWVEKQLALLLPSISEDTWSEVWAVIQPETPTKH